MTLAVDRLAYRSPQDLGIQATRGIGLAVTNLSGELWIQQDISGREQTGRKAGQLSIIFETGKPREPVQNNVLGAVSELANDGTLHVVRNNLVTMDGLQSTPRLYSANEGRPIDYSIAVVVFNGDNPDAMYNLEPHDAHETVPVGWMSPTDFLSLETEHVRPLARHAVGYLEAGGTIGRTLEDYRKNPDRREQVIPPWYNVSEFHQQRERVGDPVPTTMQSNVFYTVA
ncbi:MAG: hypothetical protein ACREHC_06595 [Candidatus Levyibacteriota bacterium]